LMNSYDAAEGIACHVAARRTCAPKRVNVFYPVPTDARDKTSRPYAEKPGRGARSDIRMPPMPFIFLFGKKRYHTAIGFGSCY